MANMGKFFIALIVIPLAVAVADLAAAGVVVTPERHIVELAPGQSQMVEYQIYNAGPQDLDITVEPKDWTKAASEVAINKWLSLPLTQFTVKAGTTVPFSATVIAPQGLDGEALAMLFLCYKEDKSSDLNIRNGIPLYLVAKGTQRYGAQILSLEAAYMEDPIMLGNYILSVMVEVKNTGNVHIQPVIIGSIKELKGKELIKLMLEKYRIILREETYTYQLDWPYVDLANGNYNVSVELNAEELTAPLTKELLFDIKGNILTMVRKDKD